MLISQVALRFGEFATERLISYILSLRLVKRKVDIGAHSVSASSSHHLDYDVCCVGHFRLSEITLLSSKRV